MDNKITVFVSYSWENEIHNKKVERFYKRLIENNINAFFDRDVPLGERITDFMELIDKSDYVLFLCTPKYKEKADKGLGGVKFEKNIITAELYRNGNERKFIPVLFSGTWEESMPIWAYGKKGIDYTKETDSEFNKLLSNLQLNSEKKDVGIKLVTSDIPTPIYQKNYIKYIMIGLVFVFVLIILSFILNGELQQKYDGFINHDLHDQETEKSNENEEKVLTPEESGTFSIEIPENPIDFNKEFRVVTEGDMIAIIEDARAPIAIYNEDGEYDIEEMRQLVCNRIVNNPIYGDELARGLLELNDIMDWDAHGGNLWLNNFVSATDVAIENPELYEEGMRKWLIKTFDTVSTTDSYKQYAHNLCNFINLSFCNGVYDFRSTTHWYIEPEASGIFTRAVEDYQNSIRPALVIEGRSMSNKIMWIFALDIDDGGFCLCNPQRWGIDCYTE